MRLYLDEDISPKVADLLRHKGIDAVSVHDVKMTGASDERQLLRAVSEERVMVTRNRNDFIILTVRFFEDTTPHHGLLIIPFSIPGNDFTLLANLLHSFVQRNPDGLQPYTIEFLRHIAERD